MDGIQTNPKTQTYGGDSSLPEYNQMDGIPAIHRQMDGIQATELHRGWASRTPHHKQTKGGARLGSSLGAHHGGGERGVEARERLIEEEQSGPREQLRCDVEPFQLPPGQPTYRVRPHPRVKAPTKMQQCHDPLQLLPLLAHAPCLR